MKQSFASDDHLDLLAKLATKHRTLKARVKELEQHRSLSPKERIELSTLKKEKLLTKDRIFFLEQLTHEQERRAS